MPIVKATLPTRYNKVRETPLTFILEPEFPAGSKVQRGAGAVRNALRRAAFEALGMDEKATQDLTKAEQAQLMSQVIYMPDNSIQVAKGGPVETVANQVAEAGPNYPALFGPVMETAEDYAKNAPSKIASGLIARAVRAFEKRDATDDDKVRLLRETYIPELQSALDICLEMSDSQLLGLKAGEAEKLADLERQLEAGNEDEEA